MTLARAVPEAPARLAHKAKRAASRAARSSFGLKTGQLFERKVALHALCMNMTCIPNLLKFMADRFEV